MPSSEVPLIRPTVVSRVMGRTPGANLSFGAVAAILTGKEVTRKKRPLGKRSRFPGPALLSAFLSRIESDRESQFEPDLQMA